MLQDEIIQAQQKWIQTILHLSQLHHDNSLNKSIAEKHLDELYDFSSEIQFKPTLAKTHPIRKTKDEALSYFIKGCIQEDSGFALKKWTHIEIVHQTIRILQPLAIAMGRYHFILDHSETIPADFTFVYHKHPHQHLKIITLHSSLA